MTLTKRDDRLVIDFAGTSPQAKGPINHAGDYADGVFLKKWLAPILRNLADSPERMAELDVNEGVVPLIELKFPPPGTLLTPVFPAPTNARTFVILRPRSLVIGREVFGLGRTREYDLTEVKNFRVAAAAKGLFAWTASARFWGLGGGPIAFDYGSKTVRVAAAVNEPEAIQIVNELKARRSFGE